MQFSTISPAPRSCTSRTQSSVSRPELRERFGSPVNWIHAIAFGESARCRCRRPRTASRSARASASMRPGFARAGEFTEIFSAPALSMASASATERMPPATQNGMSSTARHAAHPVAIHRSAFRARGDVVEHELVRAFVAIARGELEDVAHDAVIAEAHALYDLAVADVEAGDDAFGKNGRNSSDVMRSSSSALPLTAAATPVRGQRGEIGGIAHAARGLPGDLRETLHALPRTERRSGPVSAPSRSMSVHSTCFRPMRQIGARCASHSVSPIPSVQPRVRTRGSPCASMAHVEGEARCVSAPKRLSQPLHFGGLLDGGAADDDAIDAVAQQVVDHAGRAHAAADLDVQRRLRGEARR